MRSDIKKYGSFMTGEEGSQVKGLFELCEFTYHRIYIYIYFQFIIISYQPHGNDGKRKNKQNERNSAIAT